MYFLVKIVIKCSVCLFSVLSELTSPQHLLIVLGWRHLHCLGQLHWPRGKWPEMIQETCLSPDSRTNITYVLSIVETILKFIYVCPCMHITCSHTLKHTCTCTHHTHTHPCTHTYKGTHAYMHTYVHTHTPHVYAGNESRKRNYEREARGLRVGVGWGQERAMDYLWHE